MASVHSGQPDCIGSATRQLASVHQSGPQALQVHIDIEPTHQNGHIVFITIAGHKALW